jgi:threonine synthase
MLITLRCPLCNTEYAPGEAEYACPRCGQVGTLDVLYDYDALKTRLKRDDVQRSRDYSIWRYADLLPVTKPANMVQVGWTPLYERTELAKTLGVRAAYLKDDGRNPTASLKDRASAVVVQKAIELDVPIISTASTGNAAAALAGVAASVGKKVVIFVPASAPEAKIAQLLVYGATVLLVQGTYDQAFDLCLEVSQEEGWYNRSTAINPYTTEGKKTVALEIAEQLNWHVPDVVVVSVGDGNILAGVYKGFWDLLQLGWIARIPRLIGVQAAGSSALVHAWENGLSAAEMQPMPAETIADSISAGLPRDRAKALRAVRETKGGFLAVDDDAIVQSIPQLAQLTGVFAEPAAASVYAGAKRAVQLGWINPTESVVLLITGSGLKDVKRAQVSIKDVRVFPVQPDKFSVRQQLRGGEIS